VDPDDPEPQIAASAILGLWRVQFGSMARHAIDGHTAIQSRDQVIVDVRRAALIHARQSGALVGPIVAPGQTGSVWLQE
jgi:hypothetical protein